MFNLINAREDVYVLMCVCMCYAPDMICRLWFLRTEVKRDFYWVAVLPSEEGIEQVYVYGARTLILFCQSCSFS